MNTVKQEQDARPERALPPGVGTRWESSLAPRRKGCWRSALASALGF
jgi:hypothetical protein